MSTANPTVLLQQHSPRLILASASASRRALLNAAGLRFSTSPSGIDETTLKRAARRKDQDVEAVALLLAATKAHDIAPQNPDALVIGADQILVCEGIWYDKPKDVPEARSQLLTLRGRMHRLVTAATCVHDNAVAWQHVSTSQLTMRPFTQQFLEAYLMAEGNEILNSVGAYRLEGLGVHLFARIDGAEATIRGLPLVPLLAFLRDYGVLLI